MIYFIIFFFIAFLSLFTQAKLPGNLSFLVFFLVSLILICFAGFRGDIEGDYESYKDIFQQSINRYSVDANIEPAYFYFNKLVLYIGLPFQVIVFLMAVFSLLPKFYFFKKHSTNFALSVLIYYSTAYFIFDFIQIRQAVSIAIFIFALKFVYKRKFWPYFFCMIAAAQIHVSALLIIPCYFFVNFKYSKTVLYIIVGICAFINIFQITVPLVSFLLSFIPIPGFADAKLAFYQSSTDFSIVSIKQLVLAVLFIFIRGKIDSDDKLNNILVNLFVTGVLLTTCFNGMSELAFRIKWYFFWTEAILMINVIQFISRHSLTFIYLSYICLFIFYAVSVSSMLNEFASRGPYIFPYKLFFQ
ncbi:EpsG family protein [Mucilaginibacter sp. OK098]|uniref:EpsG family protein n=1 Tax=Mucilaginibacter sp. OK098 TaxID=1855297 RepID=UPI000912C94E|nr:EpsG family protein [Mucilaginibacter sp. OK098]SHN13289.1 EpsG family protein [Mucilaginibacter sp. OK098]